MKLNCVIVEDSTLQRMLIVKLVSNHPNLRLVGNFSNNSDGEKLISMIINNFIIRPHNMDVFMLRQLAQTCDFDKQYFIDVGIFYLKKFFLYFI